MTWIDIAQELGCKGCFWCDLKALGKRPCCTKPTNIEVDMTGKCLSRKEKYDNRIGNPGPA